eukprot:CAMPEP_0171111434 /NCGR_PEP_ID=MMETSP0766_2-20121228/75019_1 /TAXON_ID=439317 /ORGANISM="Gambierdiscus australes, Strain CAWD 149" /LENGTH=63 /DNA_ID=CAMNT_0011573413 /DNA_START=55 /DNA_END=243 /DNA_ORIENTATION=+
MDHREADALCSKCRKLLCCGVQCSLVESLKLRLHGAGRTSNLHDHVCRSPLLAMREAAQARAH